MITTKRGAAGKTQFGLNYYTGIQQVANPIKFLSSDEFLSLVEEGRQNDLNAYEQDPEIFGSDFDPALLTNPLPDTWYTGINTDWLDEIFRSAPVNNLEFSARAENERRGRAARGALYYIDVDRFMRINSSFGYEAGDQILRQVAQRLSECAGPHTTLARLGGDEFGVFYPNLNGRAAAEAFGEWVVQTFDAPFKKGSVDLYLTPSIGVALLPEDGRDVYELLMHAEAAAALAKRSGGNQFASMLGK